jgi:hypothetical protein
MSHVYLVIIVLALTVATSYAADPQPPKPDHYKVQAYRSGARSKEVTIMVDREKGLYTLNAPYASSQMFYFAKLNESYMIFQHMCIKSERSIINETLIDFIATILGSTPHFDGSVKSQSTSVDCNKFSNKSPTQTRSLLATTDNSTIVESWLDDKLSMIFEYYKTEPIDPKNFDLPVDKSQCKGGPMSTFAVRFVKTLMGVL